MSAGPGLGSGSVDGNLTHAPGGCIFHARSLGEHIQLDKVVLAAPNDREGVAVPAWEGLRDLLSHGGVGEHSLVQEFL
jgi:hypothetical protein